MVYPNGNTYEGMWLDGKKHGRGLMIWLDRRERYDGEWKNGLQNGIGVHTWLNDTSQKPKDEKLSRLVTLPSEMRAIRRVLMKWNSEL